VKHVPERQLQINVHGLTLPQRGDDSIDSQLTTESLGCPMLCNHRLCFWSQTLTLLGRFGLCCENPHSATVELGRWGSGAVFWLLLTQIRPAVRLNPREDALGRLRIVYFGEVNVFLLGRSVFAPGLVVYLTLL